MRCKVAAKPGKIERSVDLSYHYEIRVAKTKPVKQLTLVTLQTTRSWIDLAEIGVSRTESRFAAGLN